MTMTKDLQTFRANGNVKQIYFVKLPIEYCSPVSGGPGVDYGGRVLQLREARA